MDVLCGQPFFSVCLFVVYYRGLSRLSDFHEIGKPIDVLYKSSRDQEFRESRLVDSNACVSDVNEFLRAFSVFLE